MGSIRLRAALNTQIDFAMKNMDDKKKQEFDNALKGIGEDVSAATINNCFIFYLQPHDPSLPCIPIHIFLKKGGAADKTIRLLTDEVINLLEKDHIFDIISVSTDGDSGHNIIYDRSYNKLIEISPQLNLQELPFASF